MKTVLITGASGGIGRELAKTVSPDAGRIVLVARNDKRLEELKQELEDVHDIEVIVIQKDLSVNSAPREIVDELQQQGITVEYLINNVGIGGYGLFHEQDWDRIQSMLTLNIKVLTEFTRLLLPSMVERSQGKILNIASTAAFLPGPLLSVYYATKAYVVSFSQAIAEEVKNHGITVTAYCPGATRTDFAKRGNLESTRLFKGKIDTPERVAKDANRAVKKGVLVTGRDKGMLFVLRFILPFLSRKQVLRISRGFMTEQ